MRVYGVGFRGSQERIDWGIGDWGFECRTSPPRAISSTVFGVRSAGLLERVGLDGQVFTEMCSGSEAGSYLRLKDSCITQLKAQGPSRTCNESKEEEEEDLGVRGLQERIGLDGQGLNLLLRNLLQTFRSGQGVWFRCGGFFVKSLQGFGFL